MYFCYFFVSKSTSNLVFIFDSMTLCIYLCLNYYFSDGPEFRSRPKSVEADKYEKVMLSCDVDGNPVPHITWIHIPSNRVS